MNDKYSAYVSLAGRILLALMFIPAGFGKLTHIGGTAGYIASGGLPFPSVLAVLTGLLELFGGLALVVGFQVRWVGLAMALFTLAASVLFHPFWSVPEAQHMVTQLLFMKNISVVAVSLKKKALGAGALSLDERRSGR